MIGEGEADRARIVNAEGSLFAKLRPFGHMNAWVFSGSSLHPMAGDGNYLFVYSPCGGGIQEGGA